MTNPTAADDSPTDSDKSAAPRRAGLSIAKPAQRAQPGFRVIEVLRDRHGRPQQRGNIWHPTLDITRRFARAVASNTNSHRVLVADSNGQVLEELTLPEAGARQDMWAGSWRDVPLPSLPPRPRAVAPPAPLLAVRAADTGDVDLAIFDEP